MLRVEEVLPGCQIITCNDRYGLGKGWAVREALKEAKFDIIAFIDGDMEIDPRMFKRMMPFLEDYDIIVGKKQIRGLLSRRIITRLSRLYIWIMFGLNLDTQTGIKVFKRDAMLPWLSNSFAFDIEVLAKAKKAGFEIIEVPVEVDIKRKVKAKSLWRSLMESFKIKLNLLLYPSS
jgi:glycosyltransferase involved in cell wall biosynthesis